MLCPYCGSQIPWGAQFCTNCGRTVQQTQPMAYPLPIETPQSSHRGWFQNEKNRTRALLLLVVILSGGLFLSYIQNTSLQSRLAILQDEANGYYSRLQTSQSQNSQLQSQNAQMQSQIAQLQSQNTYLANQVQSLNLQNTHPTLSVWNSCGGPCTVTPTGPRAGGVPDTFTYDSSYTADSPVGMYFLTLSQYAQFATCASTGSAENQLTCVSGTYSYFSPTTSLNGVFHLAEGCASYVAVYYSDSSTVMYPNVSVTYNPASSSTGACA
jgi:cell division protein FtsB